MTGGDAPVRYAVVIPTTGRPSLHTLLDALGGTGPAPESIVVVDDRPQPGVVLLQDQSQGWPPPGLPPVRVLRSGGRGPAAARNTGWRAVDTEWVAFLDDDVVPGPDWPALLHADLCALAADVGASQGRIEVPLPAGRRPTDTERGTAGLAGARWITADMAYRRAALEHTGGFDERFPRAYREDADLALRVIGAGYRIALGQRRTTHPVRPAGFMASVRAQAGNADNALMRRKHGPGWRARIGDGRGLLGRHALTTASAAIATITAVAVLPASRRVPFGRDVGGPRRVIGHVGRPRDGSGRGARGALDVLAPLAGLLWGALTAEFAVRRILPGPRTPSEIVKMIVTSVLIPPAACAHRLAGELRWARAQPSSAPPPSGRTHSARTHSARTRTWASHGSSYGTRDAHVPQGGTRDAHVPRDGHRVGAVLFDRDGTLVVDVPYNADPSVVRPMPGAREALDRLRGLGVPVGVVSNQSGVACGLISHRQLAEVNARVAQLLGPFGAWQVCVHGEGDGCDCRKPQPGLIHRAADQLGVPVGSCVVIGDTGADVGAAAAAGARGILVPNARTLRAEIEAAAEVAPDITAAVELALDHAADPAADPAANPAANEVHQ